MPRLTQEQWNKVRAEREGAGRSFRDLGKEFGVDHAAIARRAKNDGWKDGSDTVEAIRRRAEEKVHGIVTTEDPIKKAEAIEAAAEKAAKVIEKHRDEIHGHRVRFGTVPVDFEDGKLAKITMEMLTLRHKAERVAWGLDGKEEADVVISNPRGRMDA